MVPCEGGEGSYHHAHFPPDAKVETSYNNPSPDINDNALVQNPVEQVDHVGLAGSTSDHHKSRWLLYGPWRHGKNRKECQSRSREAFFKPSDGRSLYGFEKATRYPPGAGYRL